MAYLPNLITLLTIITVATSNPCVRKFYGEDKSVCVCNGTYCDTFPPLSPPSPDYYQIYTTSIQNLGFTKNQSVFENSETADLVITIDSTRSYQKIIGFGGAFTDSTGINILSLSEEAQNKLLAAYFSGDGLEYNICRVPIGGTDFSVRAYSYADTINDTTLEFFKLQEEDFVYKIPIIKRAIEMLNGKPLKLFASAWTAPPWMKTNNFWSGFGFLKDEFFQLWADYYVRFFEEYEANGISFWGVTTQNEPSDGFFDVPLNSMGFTFGGMRKWVAEYLGPTIRSSNYSDLKIIMHDDTRLLVPLTALLMTDTEVLRYADGMGVHWYQDFMIPPEFLNAVQIIPKNIFLLGTEACSGSTFVDGPDNPIDLGSWSRAEHYITDIITDLNYNVTGWVDWNMALDTEGGPSYIDNNVDSTILVNATADEFYKQPMYYVMGHFSKFLIPDSVRVHSSGETNLIENIEFATFLRPDGLKVVIIYNSLLTDLQLQLVDSEFKTFSVKLAAQSLNSVLY